MQHVLDLVKLDGERIVNTGNGCRSADTCDALVSALVMRSDLFVDGRYAEWWTVHNCLQLTNAHYVTYWICVSGSAAIISRQTYSNYLLIWKELHKMDDLDVPACLLCAPTWRHHGRHFSPPHDVRPSTVTTSPYLSSVISSCPVESCPVLSCSTLNHTVHNFEPLMPAHIPHWIPVLSCHYSFSVSLCLSPELW